MGHKVKIISIPGPDSVTRARLLGRDVFVREQAFAKVYRCKWDDPTAKDTFSVDQGTVMVKARINWKIRTGVYLREETVNIPKIELLTDERVIQLAETILSKTKGKSRLDPKTLLLMKLTLARDLFENHPHEKGKWKDINEYAEANRKIIQKMKIQLFGKKHAKKYTVFF